MRGQLARPVPLGGRARPSDRVWAAPEGLPGTDRLVKELNATNPGNHVEYVRYPEGVVKPDALLGVHFGTINHDTPAMIAWLTAMLDRVSLPGSPA